jgi:hypothetical protein
VRQIAVDHMQIGAADGTGRDAQQDMTGPQGRNLSLDALERQARAIERHGRHPCGNLASSAQLFRRPRRLLSRQSIFLTSYAVNQREALGDALYQYARSGRSCQTGL